MTATAARPSAADRWEDFRLAVAAEWVKFRTVRSSFWTLLVSAALSVAAGVAFLPFIADRHRDDPAGRAAALAARQGWWFHGFEIGLLAVMILGVLVATSEYATGTIRATLAAIPSRPRVLAAKVVCFTAITFVAGAAQATAAVLVARPVLAGRGIEAPLGDGSVWGGVAMAGLAMTGAGLLGLGTGLLVRHTAGAIAAVMGVMVVASALVQLLPATWNSVVRVLPDPALVAMVTPDGDALARGPAAAVFFGYVAVQLGVAGWQLARRDA